MELAHSLLLNEEAFKRIPETKRPVFVFEWLRFLDKVLGAAQKSDIKGGQKKLVEQLTNQISESPGPPTRKLLARCLATLFSVGDTFDLFECINKCNDIIRNKDDSPSYLPTRLSAVACLGAMYEKLGRMVGRSYEETVQVLIKSLKNSESQGRTEVMLTLEKVVMGLGSAGNSCHKDIYKAARQAMTDRSMAVRFAAAKCMYQLVNEAPFMSTSELDTVASLCFRALDGSNYDVRCSVAKLLGNLMSVAQSPKISSNKIKPAKIDDVLNILASGFLKGGIGFMKSSAAGELIKGSASINREVRVGVTHAYVEFIRSMGGLWLERNITVFLNHIFDLVANPKATPTHVDAVYARKCVLFILRSIIGGMLGEKAQIAAAKEICQTIVKQMNTVGEATVEAAEGKTGSDLTASQHVLVCALHELGCLVLRLCSSASPLVAEPATGIIEPVVSVLIHPSHAARLAASWCLGSIAVALPSQLSPLLDRCMERMEKLKSSPEAVSGYSSALAALLGGVYQCPLGIPHAKGKQIFAIAEELLRTASQNSRLSLQRTQSGWLLLGALMTLGTPVIRNHLPRMLLLWRNAFPRSTRELESEKIRGDAFTWQVTLEGRAGALGAMQSFLLHCRELVTEDVIRRLLAPLDCALLMLSQLPNVIKLYGGHLKASTALVRLRLYDVLSLLPSDSFDAMYPSLLRELVGEFTLTDNPANTTTSMLRSMCHVDDSVILGSWLQETDHKAIEDQMEPYRRVMKEFLQPNSASGSGALEHDSQSLYARCPAGDPIPGPLPLGVAVIDSSVKLYGSIFPRVAHKHRLQMLQHFNECIKQAKSVRQQAVQMNIFSAVLCALKSLSENKVSLGPDDVKKAAFSLIMGALANSNPILRCASGEALGRMAQVVGDSKFIAEMAQYSFDKLKSARDVVSRTGHSLALGCLHRYVGGMGSGQHLNTSVSILLALAKDFNSPVVQVWALHALALIADSGGPMFRSYVEPTLALVLQLLLTVPPSTVDVYQCLGKCLSALITSIGPELQGNTASLAAARLYCMVCCAIMYDHPDSLVQAEAISCLQQLHMFAPRHVNLTSLVPQLCDTLMSSHLLLRRAAVACLRQLVTREAKEISEQALSLSGEGYHGKKCEYISDSGLEGTLFGMLDTENDEKLVSDVQDTIVSLLQTLAITNLSRWIKLLKDVLSASTDTTSAGANEDDVNEDKGSDDDENDDATFTTNLPDVTHPTVAPRWPTRVFSVECLIKIMSACEEEDIQFDLPKAKEIKESTGNGNYLALHLSDLIRMAFIAATSDSNELRLAGLSALEQVITKFAKVPEPEFPGHVILEQYQAQVGAALRPAFSAETPSDVTAAACEVCSTWIGSGVARDLNDLRRVHQLLVSSLAKLNTGNKQIAIYNESASTMEKLAVISAWAEVYIVAINREKEKQLNKNKVKSEDDNEEFMEHATESLLSLVQPELSALSNHWCNALKDHALLSLPSEYSSQLPPDGGAFYHPDTIESTKQHYKKSWPAILYALSLWLNEKGFAELSDKMINGDSSRDVNLQPANMNPEELNQDKLFLILGICMESLCSPTSMLTDTTVDHCLRALYTLLDTKWPRQQLAEDPVLCRELLNVMHRVILTRDGVEIHGLALDVVKQVVLGAEECLETEKLNHKENSLQSPQDEEKIKEENVKETDKCDSISILGEGEESGDIEPDKSVVFATLEVCLCLMVRQVPALNPSAPTTGFQMPTNLNKLSEESVALLGSSVTLMSSLPKLCSPAGGLAILPTILHLTVNAIREICPRSSDKNFPVFTNAVIQGLQLLCTSPISEEPTVSNNWNKMLQSAILTIIHYGNPGIDHEGIDVETLMCILSVFTIYCDKDVTSVDILLQPTLDIYHQVWNTHNTQIQTTFVQTLIGVLQRPDIQIATPYIHSLSPKLLEYLYSVCNNRPTSDQQLTLVLESIRVLETLISLADEKKRVTLVALLVPLLVSYLLEDTQINTAPQISRSLHDQAISKLMKIGPQYPDEFRTVMTTYSDLKPRLESAIRANQALKLQKAQPVAKNLSTPAKPTITLKTDFSNFK